MLREELIEKISKYFKLMDFEAGKVFDDVFNAIMEGAKNNKVVDLDNFGEFIIKYSGQGKSVEFLAKPQLDDDLNNSLTSISVPGESQVVEPDQGSIEEELRRKRETILNKLSVAPGESQKINDALTASEQKNISDTGNKTEEIDDESKKSFSDYFSAVSKETSQLLSAEELSEPGAEPEKNERIIPPNVVELHKQIVNRVPEKELASEDIGALSGIYTQQVAKQEGTNGRPYYIWYKDSEPSTQETQSLSIEYELLYQAQKEAEYRSKLKIYVTTFILFFSFVLILLIFSPLIYKVFFTPRETPVESIQEEKSTADVSQKQNTATENPPPVTNTQTEQPEQPAPQTSQTNVQQQTPQNNAQEQTPQTQTTENLPPSSFEGLTKNSLGWSDKKYRVVYILLDNNKYTIQESAWNSETKAANRLKIVESFKISGLTGNIEKVDLAEKGVWFRNLFGEFGSLEEARKKAVELRSKEE